MIDDNISDSYAGVDAASAKASKINPMSAAESKVLAAQAQALAAVQAQHALNVERITAQREPVEPGKMAKHGQPMIPHFGMPCGVSKCRGFSEGGTVTVSPPGVWRDPIADPVQPRELTDEEWEEQAFRHAEEVRLRALGHSTGLAADIEQALRAVRPADPARLLISSVTIPLCPFHAEHPDITKATGFRESYIPSRFGLQ